ncbi:MAG TPA: SBBP repeat-containing protein [Bacteroidia bacterium]|jgi:hypothetical protein|nr:SBBP repeat-containing protein [Bacteroidia bacterium]
MKKIKLLFCFSLARHSRLLATAGLFIFSFSFCEGQSWVWGDVGNVSLKANDLGSSVATDRNGNAYFTGQYSNSITLGRFTLQDSSDEAYIAKCDPTGKILWLVQPAGNSTSGSYGLSIATDSMSNVYVTGLFWDTVSFGSYTVTEPQGTLGIYLAKFDSNGNILWIKQALIPSGGRGQGNGVATDAKGDIYITGFIIDSASFGTHYLNSPGGVSDIFIAKYNANGNVLWAKQSTFKSTSASDQAYSISTDEKGNAYIAGIFQDTIIFGMDTLTEPPSVDETPFIVKFDTSGNVLWARQGLTSSSAFDSYAFGVATDRTGSVCLTGYFQDTITFGTHSLYSGSNYQAFLTKYDGTGNILWAEQSTGNGGWIGYSLSTDLFNNIYIGGAGGNSSFNTDTLKFGSLRLPSDSTSPASAFMLKFNSSGNAICGSILINGCVNGVGVASDVSGKYTYLASTLVNTVICGPDTLISPHGGTDPYVARWNSCSLETGISQPEAKNKELKVFPNPFSNTTTISIHNSPLTTHNLELDDITGRRLKSLEFSGNSYTLSAEGLAKGMYFIRVFSRSPAGNYDNLIGTSKIVVQ